MLVEAVKRLFVALCTAKSASSTDATVVAENPASGCLVLAGVRPVGVNGGRRGVTDVGPAGQSGRRGVTVVGPAGQSGRRGVTVVGPAVKGGRRVVTGVPS